jgi:hypothetical protein
MELTGWLVEEEKTSKYVFDQYCETLISKKRSVF